MFFIAHECDGKLGVADTKDCVIEYISSKQLKELVDSDVVCISDWKSIEETYRFDEKFQRRSNKLLWNACVRGEKVETLLHDKLVYSIQVQLEGARTGIDFSKSVKVFSYLDTLNCFFLAIHLLDGRKMLARISGGFDLHVLTTIVPTGYDFRQYPVCTGFMLNNILGRNDLKADTIYLCLYNKNGNPIVYKNNMIIV